MKEVQHYNEDKHYTIFGRKYTTSETTSIQYLVITKSTTKVYPVLINI